MAVSFSDTQGQLFKISPPFDVFNYRGCPIIENSEPPWASHHATPIVSIHPVSSVTSHCRKWLSCGALVISVIHLTVESWVGLNSVLEINWSSICAISQLLPPLSSDLAARPSVASPYCVSAIRYPSNTHTHTQSLWHTFCAYFHWHTHIHTPHRKAITEACLPLHTHTDCRECFVHSLTGWPSTEERGRERDWWEGEDGDSKTQKY